MTRKNPQPSTLNPQPATLAVLLLLLVCLSGRAAVFEHPAGTDSNTVYTIAFQAANSVGGPTNGVTAATAASIAATNVSQGWAYGATNLYGLIYLRKPDGRGIQYDNLTNAINAAADGDTVDIGPGFFKYEQRIAKSNITIRGAGSATVIANGYTNANGNSTPLIALRNNLVLDGFATTNLFKNRYQSFIGSFSEDGDVPFTNVVVKNISGKHHVDWYYVLQTNNCSIRFENVNVRCEWDSFVVTMSGGRCTNILFSSSFVNTGPNEIIPANAARALVLGQGTTIFAYNSTFLADQSGSIGILANASDIYARFVNCNVLGLGGTNVINSTGADLIFAGSYPSYETSIGSFGIINTPPWDAFEVEAKTVVSTNIVVPLNAELLIQSGDEFSPANTTMGLTGDWTFPASVTASTFSGNGNALTAIRPNIGSNSVAVSGNISIYFTNQDGTVYRVAAQRIVP